MAVVVFIVVVVVVVCGCCGVYSCGCGGGVWLL